MRKIVTLWCFVVALSAPMQAQAARGDISINTGPISDLVGIANFEVDYAFHPKWTGGGSFYTFDYDISDVNFDSNMGGVRFKYYMTREVLEGGWIASVSATHANTEISEARPSDGLEFAADVSSSVYTAMISYQAMWNHFNITTGFGFSYFTFPETTTVIEGIDVYSIDTSFVGGFSPNAEFRIGWRF